MGKRATKKELAERVGKRFVNKYGSPFTVIKYVSSSEVYIRFDNSWEMKTTWNNIVIWNHFLSNDYMYILDRGGGG